MTPALGLCGCGVMGRRHVLGLRRLAEVGRHRFELVGLVDPVLENAARLAETAAELLGRRPEVFPSLAAMRGAIGLDAVDVVTAPNLHVETAEEALADGLHVLVEKPIALTVRQGARMVAAAAAAGRRLGVAENYRRDPVNRLTKAALDAGLLGRPYLVIQASTGWGEDVIITPWRHLRRSCGIVVDLGVHYADILEYLLGPIETVVGMGMIVDERRRGEADCWHPADAEDLTVGVARFASGGLANLVLNLAGRQEIDFGRRLYGTGGAMSVPNDRSGLVPTLTRREGGRDVTVSGEELLAALPDFALNATTAALFGGERLAGYDRPWAEVDANLLAIEFDDFADAITAGRPAEVAGEDGLRSLAVIYAFLESDQLGRVVRIDDVLAGNGTPYQDALEAVAAEAS